MRNINKIGVAIIWLLIGHPVFAYVYQDTAEANLIYCPDKVECIASGFAENVDIPSSVCIVDDDKRGYINRLYHLGKYGNHKGTYTFQAAYANHPESSNFSSVSEVLCRYKLADSWINVTYRAIANLGVFYNTPSKWEIGKGITTKLNSTCQASTSSECPLRLKPEIVIETIVSNNQFLKVNYYANRIAINQRNDQYLSMINNDDAYVACGGATQCKIDIYYSIVTIGNPQNAAKMYYAGNIVVDMFDNMKILQINTGSSNGGSGPYLLKKWSQFNAIQFVK